ncbi:hypothetical protein DFP72DRAFT_895157 [Ephemerocybe angulata]|uniref:Uncharacterized protein n=1 Tax=Ephemerocybe angulata TaxID=980116 RepID=A0A8H6I0M0_9AGAR|nr:hypothetical protein DFP72DRAFT_895157 [Tulosesus angulatus]
MLRFRPREEGRKATWFVASTIYLSIQLILLHSPLQKRFEIFQVAALVVVVVLLGRDSVADALRGDLDKLAHEERLASLELLELLADEYLVKVFTGEKVLRFFEIPLRELVREFRRTKLEAFCCDGRKITRFRLEVDRQGESRDEESGSDERNASSGGFHCDKRVGDYLEEGG